MVMSTHATRLGPTRRGPTAAPGIGLIVEVDGDINFSRTYFRSTYRRLDQKTRETRSQP